jgi:hypothetical protein
MRQLGRQRCMSAVYAQCFKMNRFTYYISGCAACPAASAPYGLAALAVGRPQWADGEACWATRAGDGALGLLLTSRSHIMPAARRP